MKKLIVSIIAVLLVTTSVKASHVLGGEISWRCLPTGQYIFSMTVFRDCTGIPFGFNTETINIQGNPLPTTNGGQVVQTITVQPDSNRWLNSKNGDTSPGCTDQYGQKYTCPNEDEGTVQAFWYTSNPVTLNGIPPSSGWTFVWQSPCCRPTQIENVQTTGSMLLRAIMYPGPGGINANPCYDSSPQFRALPTTLICRGYEFTYNHTAIDNDLDSLIYSWDRPYNPPMNSPSPLPYKPGYSPTSPTPGTGANINNIPATLDPISGITKLAVYSGFGVKKFITVARVDAYREGQRIATVFREIPISLFDCPPLPNGNINNVPVVYIDGIPTRSVVSNIVAGQTISIPVQVVDNDLTGVGRQLQVITMVPDGLLFTTSRGENSPCQIPADVEPCAFLRNQNPFVDQTQTPAISVIKGLGIIGTEFSWQTDCKHIRTRTGFPGTNEGIYNFVMRVFDDHCPIPALNYPTITVRVKDPFPLTEPIMKGASVDLTGKVTYSWVPPLDSTFGFDRYEVKQSRTTNNQPPVLYTNVESNLRRYKKDHTVNKITVYELNDPFDLNSGSNLLRPLGERQGINYNWFVRMRAYSGCTDTNTSAYAQDVRVMEVTTTPIGVGNDPARSKVRLNWNRPKPLNSNSYNYFLYESPTHFYIYANDSIRQGPITNKTFKKGEENPNFWYLVGDTNALTYELDATSCNDFIGFRVEARDTVVTWKQGVNFDQRDSLDTLTYSTFSIIDTMFMVTNSFIPTPKFDTIEVLADGRVFLRINLKNKATTGRYQIFQNDTNAANLLASVNALEDSVVVLNGALTNIKNIIIRAIDICDINNKKSSLVYNTFIANGREGVPCSGQYIVTWPNPPGGFPRGIAGYRVFVDSTGGNYELVGTYPATATQAIVYGLKKATTYNFKVIAYDADGAVNISAPHTFTTPQVYANNDVVFAPEARCTFVENNGSVTVSWIPALDTSDNFEAYRFRYREANSGGPWKDVTGEENLPRTASSFTFTAPGLNAQLRQYEFELNTLSGCTGTTPHPNPSIISSVFVLATPQAGDPQKKGDIMWNPPGPIYASGNHFDLYRDTANSGYSDMFFQKAVNTNMLVDASNGAICDGIIEYYVLLTDSAYGSQYRCATRSNIADARYVDSIPPAPINLNYASFNLMNRGLDLYWNGRFSGDSALFRTLDGLNSGLQEYRNLGGVIEDVQTAFISRNILDARDTSVAVGMIIKDQCDNVSDIDLAIFHKTMEVEVDWSVCDSTNTITWNPYFGFASTDTIHYDIYENTTDNFANWRLVGTTTDTTFNKVVTVGDLYYRYHVRAYTNDEPSFVSNSNIDSAYSTFVAEPLYGNLTYATVLPSKNVEIEYYRDTVIKVKGYTLFKGSSKTDLSAIDFRHSNDINGAFVKFNDKLAKVDQASYYYRVVAQNDCDIPVGPSNFGRTILLTVNSDDEGLKNTLSWNRYEEWDSTVAYYNIYRATEGIYPTEIYKVVEPNSNYTYNTYVDDLYNETTSGKFCYRIEAVQGAVNDDVVNNYPNNLKPATSSSNVACELQEPLMYVPNAFAPDGVNKRFGPSGTFFDLSRFEMAIYNRWGEQVFITRDITEGWDGTINGEDAGIGSYVYMIRYADGDGKEHRLKGTVTLIR